MATADKKVSMVRMRTHGNGLPTAFGRIVAAESSFNYQEDRMRLARRSFPFSMLLALCAWSPTAAAQTRPPDGCVAYVHFAADGPSTVMDYGLGLWFSDGEIVQTMPAAGDQVVQVILPSSAHLAAKPVVVTGNGGQGWIAYVGDPLPLDCGDSYVTVPLSKLG